MPPPIEPLGLRIAHGNCPGGGSEPSTASPTSPGAVVHTEGLPPHNPLVAQTGLFFLVFFFLGFSFVFVFSFRTAKLGGAEQSGDRE